MDTRDGPTRKEKLYIAGSEEIEVDKMPPWADDPELLVADLEETTAGCHWLLERWEEYRDLLDRRLKRSVASESGGSDEPVAEQGSGPVVGQDSNLVLGDSMIDKIGILSHEGMGDEGFQQSVESGDESWQEAPNEAKFGSTQEDYLQKVKSE